jgi:hypothetical protein
VELLSLGEEKSVFVDDDHEVPGVINVEALLVLCRLLTSERLEKVELGREDEIGASVLS